MREQPIDEYLTSVDVAKLLDPPVVPDRVRQLARAGKLRPAVVTPSGVRLFTRTEVERYQRERGRGLVGVGHAA